tara:strand:+ start:100 stop:1122 length:1023 start_codon:yes stop_codon:yes gene_type:complete
LRFIGNKKNLLDFIDKSLDKNIENITSVADVFSGSTSVAQHFKKNKKLVFSNDLLNFSYILQRAYIQTNNAEELSSIEDLSEYFNILNNNKPKKGFFYEQFAPSESKNSKFNRNYLSLENAGKIDAALGQINIWKKNKEINENLFFYLLTSLLEAIPFVSNIAGTYGAFLKNDDPRKFKEIYFNQPEIIFSAQQNKAYNLDSVDFLNKIHADLIYFDPPYNSRQYASNYHLLERVAVQDYNIPDSKTGLHNYETEKSDWCYKSKVQGVFKENLYTAIDCSNSKFILMSYNSEGLLSKDFITDTLQKYGILKIDSIKYPRFRNAKKPDSFVEEYLFFLSVK